MVLVITNQFGIQNVVLNMPKGYKVNVYLIEILIHFIIIVFGNFSPLVLKK